jgi:hypothetical protein
MVMRLTVRLAALLLLLQTWLATSVAHGGVVVAGLVGRKADKFAALLEGHDAGAAASDPTMSQLANIAQRLSSVPQPTAAFRSSLRDQLMASAQSGATAAPHAAATHSPASHSPASHSPASTQAAQPPTTHVPTVPTPRVDPTQGLGSASGAGSGTSAATSTAAGSAGAAGGGLSSSITSGVLTLGKSAPLWAKLFAGIAAVSVSATGVAVGADRALPGDLFYGVKQQVEAIQLDLASGARGKATAQLNFARARLSELDKLLKRDHVVPGQPVSSEVAKRINGLLEAWAEDAGVGTTSLIQQIRGLGSSASNAALSIELRNELSTFTSQQFKVIGNLLGDMPNSSLQSLTVSALGYLQRVDRALGHDPATLIGKLPVTLNQVPGVSKVLPRLVLPSSIPTKNGQAVLPNPNAVVSGAAGAVSNLPGAVKSLLPSGVVPSGLVPSGLVPSALPTTLPGITLPSVGPSGITLPSLGGGVQLPGVAPVQSAVASLGNILPSAGSALPSLGGVLPPQPGVVGLLPSLGSIPGLGSTPTGSTSTGSSGSVPNPVPSAVQSIPGAIKSAGGQVISAAPSAVQSVAGAVKSAGSAVVSAAPNAVQSVAGAIKNSGQSAVSGTVATITGGVTSSAGPSLPLPAAIPVLPALPKIPGLPGLK